MEKIEPILPSEEDDRGRTASNARWFLVAVPWIGRVDSQFQHRKRSARSRGGLSNKLHLAEDATGYPLRLVVTEGQVADISFASEMIEHLRAKAAMPPRSNWETKCHYGRALHRTRNLVERFFNRVRHFLRGSARYNKLADSHFVFASLAWCPGRRAVSRWHPFIARSGTYLQTTSTI
jgi:transposase